MKCFKCKKETPVERLSPARNAQGEVPIKKNANKYCAKCEELVFQMNVLKDGLDKLFESNGYYKTKEDRKRLMALVSTQISSLEKDKYTCLQIRLILTYMMETENIAFNETILGLVPYYYVKASRYHTDLFRIANSKKYGYIEPTGEKVDKPAHKPNRNALKITNMELI